MAAPTSPAPGSDPTATDSEPQHSITGTIIAVLPLALGQAFLIWQVESAQINFFEVVMMTISEVFLSSLAAILFFSTSKEIRTRRLHSQKGLILFLIFASYIALSLTTLMQRHYHDQPAGMIVEMLAVVSASLTGPTILRSLLYLGITLGLSVIIANTSADGCRTWYAHQIIPAGMSFTALLFSLILGLFPTVMQAQDYPTRLYPIVGVELTALIGVLRVALAALVARKMTAADLDKMYSDFLAGKEGVEVPTSRRR